MSAQPRGWDDVVPIGRALYAAAPDRCIFGTDWPHTHSQKEGGGPQESALIDLLYRYLPDAKARQAVLVDNPARLHGSRSGCLIASLRRAHLLQRILGVPRFGVTRSMMGGVYRIE